MNRTFWSDRPVGVLGGTGFLGHHLIETLLAHGANVRDLSLIPSRKPHSGVNYHVGDVRDPQAVRNAIQGSELVFVLAGPVGAGLPVDFARAHSLGLQSVLNAVPSQTRVVCTSSIVAIGACGTGEVLTEDSPFNLASLKVEYVRAKRAAEEAALAAAADRDVVVVNPGYLFGPVDFNRSVMGRFCVRTWRGNYPFRLPGGINAVDVRDVARGHLLAAEHGQCGRRYILGGENVTYSDLTRRLLAAAGLRPRFAPRLPAWLLSGAAATCETIGRIAARTPALNREFARVARRFWFCDSSRARSELGYTVRPLDDTLRDAWLWHAAHGRALPRGLNRWLFPPIPGTAHQGTLNLSR